MYALKIPPPVDDLSSAVTLSNEIAGIAKIILQFYQDT
jgi:hypothetical protein